MNAISRALKKGETSQNTMPQAGPTSPKTRRGHAPMELAVESTPVAKQHLSEREGGDIDIGMLDQEAFARVIASGQAAQAQNTMPQQMAAMELDDDEGNEVVDDSIYRPSIVELPEGADPIWSLRLTCLPILDILSTELLKILSSHQHSTILQIVTGTPASPLSHNYNALLHLFDATKKQLYSEESSFQPFLDPDALGFKINQERKVIRKVNLATFISSVFGSADVGFFHLNEGFLGTMAPDGGRLLKDMARLFLDLKTQAYISAMGQPSRDQNSILNDLFPSTPQLTLMLVSRRTVTEAIPVNTTIEDLTPAEVEFVTKCERRRELLRSIGDGDEQVRELKDTYSWETFLRELRGYIAKNWEIIVGSRGGKGRRPVKKRVSAPGSESQGAPFVTQGQQELHGQGDVSTSLPTDSQTTNQPIWEAYEKAKMAQAPANVAGPAGSSMGNSASGIPPPQAKPTVQGTPRNMAEGSQVRRPWTKEEENALFAGLEAVQGPNWAAILQLYGPGGSISEALKDRSQVQLKDKARNLKLFFLKGGHEMPRVLEKVTGRLKGDRGEDTPERRAKKRKAEDVQHEQGMPTSQQSGFPEVWQGSPGQGAEFMGGVVGQNVDPGLQMPQAG